jgi:hypothetical protein
MLNGGKKGKSEGEKGRVSRRERGEDREITS